jgi:hypothetical protein
MLMYIFLNVSGLYVVLCSRLYNGYSLDEIIRHTENKHSPPRTVIMSYWALKLGLLECMTALDNTKQWLKFVSSFKTDIANDLNYSSTRHTCGNRRLSSSSSRLTPEELFYFAVSTRTWKWRGECNPQRSTRVARWTSEFRTCLEPCGFLKVIRSRTHRALF